MVPAVCRLVPILHRRVLRIGSDNIGSLHEFIIGTMRMGRFDPVATRVPANVRPREGDPRPPAKGLAFDPNLGKTKWRGTTGDGQRIGFDFDDKGVTITHGDKVGRHAVRLNTYAEPMTIDFYPEDGGDPIRCLLEMTGLGEIALHTDFRSKRPKLLGPNGAKPLKLKRGESAPLAARGFQEDDGKGIDARFAKTIVADGTTFCAGEVGTYAGDNTSAGPRTSIASKNLSMEVPMVGHHWVVRQFKDGDGPRQYVANLAKDPRFTVQSFDVGTAGYKVVARDIAADHVTDTVEAYSKAGMVYDQSSHLNVFVYREKFIVMYSHREGRRGHDFTKESKRIAEKTKALIDERLPPDEPK